MGNQGPVKMTVTIDFEASESKLKAMEEMLKKLAQAGQIPQGSILQAAMVATKGQGVRTQGGLGGRTALGAFGGQRTPLAPGPNAPQPLGPRYASPNPQGNNAPVTAAQMNSAINRRISRFAFSQLDFSSPLDLGISAVALIPEVGGPLSAGMKLGREIANTGAPIIKGVLEGMAKGQSNPVIRTAMEAAAKTFDTIAEGIAKTEAWNQSFKEAAKDVVQMAAGAAVAGIVPNPEDLKDFAIKAFDVEESQNSLERRFRQWNLQYSGEAIGSALSTMAGATFNR